jgi:hypothetical protein
MYLIIGTQGSKSSMDQIARILHLRDNKSRNPSHERNFRLWNRESAGVEEAFSVFSKMWWCSDRNQLYHSATTKPERSNISESNLG